LVDCENIEEVVNLEKNVEAKNAKIALID